MEALTNFKIKSMSAQLLVADIDRSLRFYTEVLGFRIDFQYEDFYVGLVKDGCSIHLKSVRTLPRQGENKGTEDLDLVFSVFDLEHLYEILSGKAIDIVQPLRQMPYGKEFYIADPDGYMICFFEAS